MYDIPQCIELLVIMNSDYSYSFKSSSGYYIASSGTSTAFVSTITDAAKWIVSRDSYVQDDRVCIKNIVNGKYLGFTSAGAVSFSTLCNTSPPKFTIIKKSYNEFLKSLIGLEVSFKGYWDKYMTADVDTTLQLK